MRRTTTSLAALLAPQLFLATALLSTPMRSEAQSDSATEWRTVLDVRFQVAAGAETFVPYSESPTAEPWPAQLHAMGSVAVVYPATTGSSLYNAQVVRLKLAGDSTFGPIAVGLNSRIPSYGFVSSDRPGKITFDLFLEFNLGGKVFRNATPIRVGTTVNHFPGIVASYRWAAEQRVKIMSADEKLVGYATDANLRLPVRGQEVHAARMQLYVMRPGGSIVSVGLSGQVRVERGNPSATGADAAMLITGLDMRGTLSGYAVRVVLADPKAFGHIQESAPTTAAPARASVEFFLQVQDTTALLPLTNRMPLELTGDVAQVPLVNAMLSCEGRAPLYRGTAASPAAWIRAVNLYLGNVVSATTP